MSSAAASSRSLAPREHGAYGQLGVPLVAGLLLGAPNIASIGMAVGAFATFFAHEPLLVLLGQRGSKARAQDGTRAGKRLALLMSIALLFGGAGLLFASTNARFAAVPPLVLACIVAWFVWRKEEKTAAGEIIAAMALSGAGFPIALAGGIDMHRAGLVWLVWTLAFAIATLSVRAVIARAKHAGQVPIVMAYVLTLGTCAATVGLAFSAHVPVALPIALSPFFVLGLGVLVLPVHTKHLRRVGWGLVAASVATLAIVVGMLR